MISDSTIITVVGIVVAAGPLWIAAWRQGTKTAEIVNKVDAVGAKADHIETLTNSTLADVKTELATANGHNKALQDLIKSLAERNGRVDSATRVVKVEDIKVEPTKGNT